MPSPSLKDERGRDNLPTIYIERDKMNNKKYMFDISSVWQTIGVSKVKVIWSSDRKSNRIELINLHDPNIIISFRINKKSAEDIIYNFACKDIIHLMERYKKITKCSVSKPEKLPPAKGGK